MHDRVLEFLDEAPQGLTTRALTDRMGLDPSPENQAAVRIAVLMMREIREEDGRWRTVKPGKRGLVLAALENYASATGKRIFRVSSALSGLPAEEQPTESEIVETISDTHGRFQMLPNAMIKFNP